MLYISVLLNVEKIGEELLVTPVSNDSVTLKNIEIIIIWSYKLEF